jgi:hypothetical protein
MKSGRNGEIVARLAAGATLRQVASEFGVTWQKGLADPPCSNRPSARHMPSVVD